MTFPRAQTPVWARPDLQTSFAFAAFRVFFAWRLRVMPAPPALVWRESGKAGQGFEPAQPGREILAEHDAQSIVACSSGPSELEYLFGLEFESEKGLD